MSGVDGYDMVKHNCDHGQGAEGIGEVVQCAVRYHRVQEETRVGTVNLSA